MSTVEVKEGEKKKKEKEREERKEEEEKRVMTDVAHLTSAHVEVD